MTRLLFAVVLLALQVRTPETLRPAATPPPEGSGHFREFAYTYRLDSRAYAVEFAPALPDQRPVILDAMKSVCRDLFDLDFTKVPATPGPGEHEWRFELQDLRVCYGRQLPGGDASAGVKSVRVWMP